MMWLICVFQSPIHRGIYSYMLIKRITWILPFLFQSPIHRGIYSYKVCPTHLITGSSFNPLFIGASILTWSHQVGESAYEISFNPLFIGASILTLQSGA